MHGPNAKPYVVQTRVVIATDNHSYHFLFPLITVGQALRESASTHILVSKTAVTYKAAGKTRNITRPPPFII